MKPLKKLIWSMVAMILLGFASVCTFEASYDLAKISHISHGWFDAIAVVLFIASACTSVLFENAIETLRHDKI